ncbi:MAG: TlpA disulfide reductase family protein [Alphaproteobacteria bacterium]|nr:TlpA disulfide reductase family protein [Alphaproteobacteria bacterium]
MNKQKISKILSTMGLLFMIWLGISYVYYMKNRGDLLPAQIGVPDDFGNEFSRVTTMRREQKMGSTPFLSPEGLSTDWADFKGEYLLVNFWATWCGPCVIELPSLGRLQQKMEDKGLKIIAVSLDLERPQDDIKQFLKNRGIGEFAAYLDHQQAIQKNIYMRGIPTSYLIDPKGNIAYIFEGDAHWDSVVSVNFFENLLNQEKL